MPGIFFFLGRFFWGFPPWAGGGFPFAGMGGGMPGMGGTARSAGPCLERALRRGGSSAAPRPAKPAKKRKGIRSLLSPSAWALSRLQACQAARIWRSIKNPLLKRPS